MSKVIRRIHQNYVETRILDRYHVALNMKSIRRFDEFSIGDFAMTKFSIRSFCVFAFAVISTVCCLDTANAAFNFNTLSYSQNFDTLTTTTATAAPFPAWNNDAAVDGANGLDGWYLYNQTGAAITTFNGGTGSSTGGMFYSFGATATSERALGGLGSGGAYFGGPATGDVAGWMALGLVNNNVGTIASINVLYDGEQWRNGGNTAPHTMVLEIGKAGFSGTFASVAQWAPAGPSFNFTSPIATSTAGALSGNAAANRVENIGGDISSLTFGTNTVPLNWGFGEVLWLRWVERNETGNDHGLAIDNFSLTAQLAVVPELPTFYTFGSLIGAFGIYGLATTYFKRRRAV